LIKKQKCCQKPKREMKMEMEDDLGLGFNAKNENQNGWKKGWTWLKLNEKIGWKKTNLGYFPRYHIHV